MSRVLVTGANGFLGSWLTRRLLAEGHEIFALVRKSSDLSELDGVPCQYIYGDVTNLDSLPLAFKGIDTVFHAAGLVAYKKSERGLMEKVNVTGTQNVIHACSQMDVSRLVHISSVVAVGAGFKPEDILNEESAYTLSHLNLGYFETKRKAEQLVVAATQSKKIDSVILNPSTIYGAGDARKGSRKTQVNVARGSFKFYTSGGVNVVALEDVIDGILSAWKVGRTGERYILCGENWLIKDLFSEIALIAGQSPPPYKMPDFILHALGIIGDQVGSLGLPFPVSRENSWTATLYHWFSSEKAQKELKFKPSSSKQALRNSIQWMKENNFLS